MTIDISKFTNGLGETFQQSHARMQDTAFIACSHETDQWLAANPQLREMHELAVEDYITARHAIGELGLFRSGLPLAAQAVEKLLKCHLLAYGVPLSKVGSYGHKLPKLLLAVSKLGTPELGDHIDFCKQLESWYFTRYPEESPKAMEWMRSAVVPLDKLVISLDEKIPMPKIVEHLKYGGGISGHAWRSTFVRIFVATSSQHVSALVKENLQLQPRLPELQKRFNECRRMCAIPAMTLEESQEHIRQMEALTFGCRE